MLEVAKQYLLTEGPSGEFELRGHHNGDGNAQISTLENCHRLAGRDMFLWKTMEFTGPAVEDNGISRASYDSRDLLMSVL